MGSIEIYFAGLICHVGPSEKEGSDRTVLVRSILITDRDHQPKICTSADSPSADLGTPLSTGVTFSHLGAAASTCDQLFLDTVPHLDDLTLPGVTLLRDPPGLQVHLPAGVFTVVQFYSKEGAHWKLGINDTKRACVPSVTMLRATGQNVGVQFNNNKDEVRLGDAGWVLITNLEGKGYANKRAGRGNVKSIANVSGEHWQKHHTVTTGGSIGIATWGSSEPGGTEVCTPSQGIYASDVLKHLQGRPYGVDSSECTNSHWP